MEEKMEEDGKKGRKNGKNVQENTRKTIKEKR